VSEKRQGHLSGTYARPSANRYLADRRTCAVGALK
jgi:hypothetical protein